MRFSKLIPITKVDAAKREVWGVATAEAPDKDGEICDYQTTKPNYQKWSAEIAKATGGQSLGNVREMHQPSAVGKIIAIDFDDAEKHISVGAKIVDDEAWRKCAAGVYTGFSHGGRYVKSWPDPADETLTRYTADPSEISIVDNPALEAAHFEFLKADGGTEMRKFAKAQRTKRVAGEDLPASAFAYVGDPERTETWKLPIKFSTDAKTESHIRNALARFGETEGIPEAERAKVKARIVAAAKEHGISVAQEEQKAAISRLRKSLYEVSEIAGVLSCLACAQQALACERDIEGDDSKVPDDLQGIVRQLGELLVALAEEETTELSEGGLKMGLFNSELAKAKDVREHVKRMHKLHKAHSEAMDEHFEKLHKALGAADEDDDDGEKEDGDEDDGRRDKRKAAGLERRLAALEKSMDGIAEAQHALAGVIVSPPKAALNGAAITKSQDNGAARQGDDALSLIKAELASGGKPYYR